MHITTWVERATQAIINIKVVIIIGDRIPIEKDSGIRDMCVTTLQEVEASKSLMMVAPHTI